MSGTRHNLDDPGAGIGDTICPMPPAPPSKKKHKKSKKSHSNANQAGAGGSGPSGTHPSKSDTTTNNNFNQVQNPNQMSRNAGNSNDMKNIPFVNDNNITAGESVDTGNVDGLHFDNKCKYNSSDFQASDDFFTQTTWGMSRDASGFPAPGHGPTWDMFAGTGAGFPTSVNDDNQNENDALKFDAGNTYVSKDVDSLGNTAKVQQSPPLGDNYGGDSKHSLNAAIGLTNLKPDNAEIRSKQLPENMVRPSAATASEDAKGPIGYGGNGKVNDVSKFKVIYDCSEFPPYRGIVGNLTILGTQGVLGCSGDFGVFWGKLAVSWKI